MSPDDKLTQFLSKNRPTPGAAPLDEKDRIWARISRMESIPFLGRPFMRIAAPIASLAMVLLVVIFVQLRPAFEGENVAANIDSAMSLAFLSDENIDDETDPLAVLADAM